YREVNWLRKLSQREQGSNQVTSGHSRVGGCRQGEAENKMLHQPPRLSQSSLEGNDLFQPLLFLFLAGGCGNVVFFLLVRRRDIAGLAILIARGGRAVRGSAAVLNLVDLLWRRQRLATIILRVIILHVRL